MEFRLATPDDVPALAAMRWDFRAEGGEVPIESPTAFAARYAAFVRAGLAAGQWAYWVAEDTPGTLVAHMAIGVIRSVPRPGRQSDQWGYLTDCYTRPAYRGRGVGAALLARVQAWAVGQDLELLLVSPSEASRAFYARAGFVADAEFQLRRLRDYDASAPSASGTELRAV
jgi:GNAT superfamily N-acetyltransferase